MVGGFLLRGYGVMTSWARNLMENIKRTKDDDGCGRFTTGVVRDLKQTKHNNWRVQLHTTKSGGELIRAGAGAVTHTDCGRTDGRMGIEK